MLGCTWRCIVSMCAAALTTVAACRAQLLAKAWVVCLVTTGAMLAHEWADTMCFARVRSPPDIAVVDELPAAEFARLWQYKQAGLPVVVRGVVRVMCCTRVCGSRGVAATRGDHGEHLCCQTSLPPPPIARLRVGHMLCACPRLLPQLNQSVRLDRWSPDRLAQDTGDAVIEVQLGADKAGYSCCPSRSRASHPLIWLHVCCTRWLYSTPGNVEQNSTELFTLPFREFLAGIQSEEWLAQHERHGGALALPDLHSIPTLGWLLAGQGVPPR